MKIETKIETVKGIVCQITTYIKDNGEFIANNIRKL
jgi:hypothetical protein